MDIERISFSNTVHWLLTAAAGEALPELVIIPTDPIATNRGR